MKKNGRNTTLTRFGEEFLSCAEHTLSTLDEGITTLHRNARGEGLILITPQSHPLSAKDSVDLVETIPYPQIFFEKSAGIRNVIDQMFARTGDSPKIAYETEEDQVIAGLVAQGFGIAVVPYMDILQKLNVNILQIRSPNYERAFFMVHNDCVFIPPVVQKFRQFVLDDGMMLTEEPA